MNSSANVLLTLILVELFAGGFYLWVFKQLRALRKAPSLSLNVNARPCSSNDVTVVIAARNEAGNIERCLNAILNQEAVANVIVVDDHSTDRTFQTATELAAKEHRLRVLASPGLPEGWIGKSYALQYGSRQVATKYMLFTDADVDMKPGIISAALKRMEHNFLDHLSGQFFLKCETIAEQVCAPALMASSTIVLFLSARDKGSATGAFNMVRSDFYRRSGEHNSIRSSLIDDVALARHVKSCGGKTEFVFMSDNISVRLFNGFTGFFSVIHRTALPYLKMAKAASFIKAMAFLLLGLATGFPFCIYPFIQFSPSACMPALLSATIVAYVLGFSCAYESRRYHNARVYWLLFYPAALIVMAFAVAWSAQCSGFGKAVYWRGRNYKAG